MSDVRVIFPESDEEKEEATALYEEGKAGSGEDPQQGEEDEGQNTPKESFPVNRLK